MKNGRKVLISVALTIFVLMWLLPYHVYCDTDIGDWHIDLLSYTYDESEQGFAPLDAMDYIQKEYSILSDLNDFFRSDYGITRESDIQYIQENRDYYRYSWLTIETTIPTSLIDMTDITVELTICEDQPLILLAKYDSMMLKKQADGGIIIGYYPAYINVDALHFSTDYWDQCTIEAIVSITTEENHTDQFSIPVDLGSVYCNNDNALTGFAMHIDYCDVYELKDPDQQLFDRFDAENVETKHYYMAYLRGTKEKNMDEPVLNVSFALDEPGNNVWIEKNNSSMFAVSGDSDMLAGDDMYQNGNEYVEIRLLIGTNDELSSHSLNDLIKNHNIAVYFSTESFQHPLDKVLLTDGEHNGCAIGPKRKITVDNSDFFIRFHNENDAIRSNEY